MRRSYIKPDFIKIKIEISQLLITNSGNTGATIPGMEWGAAHKRSNGWEDYEQ